MKKKVLLTIGGIIACIICILVCGASCSSCDRMGKSIESNMSGGLDRTIKIYSYDGKLLSEHKGKFDVQDSENKILFDLDGKRYIYYNTVAEIIEK